MQVLKYIQKNIDDFKEDIFKLDRFLTGTLTSYSFFQDQYPEVVREFGGKERSVKEAEGMKILESLNESISLYELDIYKYCFINIIARIDSFLNDVARSIYLWRMNELDDIEREKIILRFSHSSFKDKLTHFKNKFDLIFPEVNKWESSIVELFSTRNIILHNNGLVNETYLRINSDSHLEIGCKRVVGEKYLKLAIVIAIIISKSIEKQLHLKANSSQAES